MKLTILGGSAAGTNTGQGCSGSLVESEGTRVVLDLGPGTLQELRKHTDYRTLSGVVISHMHLDHIGDLLALRFALAYNPISPAGPISLYLPPGGAATLYALGDSLASQPDPAGFFGSVFSITEYDPVGGLLVDDLRLTFTPTVHFIPCWAIRLRPQTSGAGDLTYTADSGPAANLADFARDSEVLLAEATYIDPPETPFAERGHLTAAETGQIASAANVQNLVLTHMWEELGFDNYRSGAASAYGGPVALATPGLQIEW
jgi:ribonuclease BN (tRNA processing enzyme)